ncbi:hypothetical protein OUZ56_030761 [Daphnia magna]|uniref:Uncharacterized protein n=1 Tax=Daphnia magna TaxID=35525 RepID=A0ABQ9ZT53_9CRUS|nr:hypothetical protein OUZ56_030761 [Daphnia magna]
METANPLPCQTVNMRCHCPECTRWPRLGSKLQLQEMTMQCQGCRATPFAIMGHFYRRSIKANRTT